MLPDYYKIFGLKKSASKIEIKKRYRELAKQFHPDVNTSPYATSKMQEILEAYYILYDDEAKERYDKQYERIHKPKNESHKENNQNKSEFEQSKSDETVNQYFNDPILENWINNAKKQAFDFMRNTYKDSTGITKSGCKYFFYGLGFNILILIFILFIIIIYRAIST